MDVWDDEDLHEVLQLRIAYNDSSTPASFYTSISEKFLGQAQALKATVGENASQCMLDYWSN